MSRTVLITGASGGLGLELAKLFAKDGYRLVLVARSEDKLCAIKTYLESQYHTEVDVIVKDLSRVNAAMDIFRYTKERRIEVDILINNAGFGDFGSFAGTDLDKQSDMAQVNMIALMQLCHLYVRPMIRRGNGKILNMASVAAFEPGPLMAVYYASKAFVLSFSEALSVELKGTGVTVTALCPGPTKTGFEEHANLGSSGLFKHLKNAGAAEVARYGYKKMKQRRVVAVPGLMNKAVVAAVHFLPRTFVRHLVYTIQK